MPFDMRDILEKIEALEIRGGDPRVASALIDLTRDPNADLDDYADLTRGDPDLAGRLLSLVNSSWFAPSVPIRTTKQALCMLGIAQANALILSHCIASMHASLDLDEENARSLWGAAICKALALAKLVDPTIRGLADVAFLIGIFQDIGLALLASIDPDAVRAVLSDPELTITRQLQMERAHFGMDHALAGRKLAQKLGLPTIYVQAIGAHHRNGDDWALQGEAPPVSAIRKVSFFPHDLRWWPASDAQQLAELLEGSGERNLEGLVSEVQTEFSELNSRLGKDSGDDRSILTCLREASQMAAKETAAVVGRVNALATNNRLLVAAARKEESARRTAEKRAGHDPLTGLLNRSGWTICATGALDAATSQGSWIGLGFFDVDGFKQINDSHGHAAGDACLVEISSRIRASVRGCDLVCRWGGDEILIVFVGATRSECSEAVQRVKAHVEAKPITFEGVELPVSLSCGFVAVRGGQVGPGIPDLVKCADRFLYKAKSELKGSLFSGEYQAA